MSETCAWCGEPEVTRVITRTGRKNRKTAPVCEAHAQDFESRGQLTVRLEVEQKMAAEHKRGVWTQRHQWR